MAWCFASRPAGTVSCTWPGFATVTRFSTLAGLSVATILATGILQSTGSIDAWSELLHTAYGRAVLIKFVLLIVLLGLGAINRQRVVPALRRAAADETTPGAAGVTLRRTLRSELTLGVVVFAGVIALRHGTLAEAT